MKFWNFEVLFLDDAGDAMDFLETNATQWFRESELRVTTQDEINNYLQNLIRIPDP